MTRKKDTALAQPVNADKWERQRQAERITLQDRKTVPHRNSTVGGRYEGKDLMPVGSFRLAHAYSHGGRRYAYNVTPDTAAWVAAATLAVHAMTEAIHKANQHTIAGGKPWTKKQQSAIAQANAILEAAGIWSGRGWTTAQAYDVAQAGIDAVTQWANQPKDTK